MLGSPIVRITVQPRLLTDGSLQTLRMAGGGDNIPYLFGGNHYRAGVVDLPRFGANFGWDENGWNGAARPQSSALRWSPSVAADLAKFASLYLWKDAPITADIGYPAQRIQLGPEKVLNGDASGGTTANWTAENAATLSVVSGKIRVTCSGTIYPRARQNIATAPGISYRYSVDITPVTAAAFVQFWSLDAANNFVTLLAQVSATGTNAGTFVAPSAGVAVLLTGDTSTNGQTADFDNVSLKEVTILSGDAEPTSWTTVLSGSVREISTAQGVLSMTIADFAAKLDIPVVSAHFAGTGGIEGPAEAEGREKRRSFGYVFNVEGRILDKANNIWEFNDPAFPLQSIVEVRDKGRAAAPAPTSVAWQGSIAATFTALQAAAAATGSGVIAPSIGCVKWWTQPAGPLTADLIGSGDYGNTAVALTKHICNERGISMSTTPANVTSLMANTANAGVHVGDDRMTSANAIDRLLLGAGLVWRFATAGTLDLLPIDMTAASETLIADRITRERIFMPHRTRRLGYKRNERQHNDAEISAALYEVNVTGPSQSTVFKYDSQGVALGGEFNRDLVFQLATVAGTVSDAVTWTYQVLTGTVNTFQNGDGVKSMSGSSGVGTLTVSSLGTDAATVKVTATYPGGTRTTTFPLTKSIAPPPQGGSGSGGTGNMPVSKTSGWTYPVNSTTFTEIGRLTGTMPAGKTTAQLDATINFSPDSGTNGNWTIEMKWQRDISGTFTDIGTVGTGTSYLHNNPDEGEIITDASITKNVSDTGLTAGNTYTWRLVARLQSGTRGQFPYGTANISAP